MKHVTKVLSGLLLIILIIACSIDGGANGGVCTEDFTGALKSNETVLAGTWTLTGITSDTEVDITEDDEDNPSQDIFAQYSDCRKDAEYRFETDRAFRFAEGQKIAGCSNQLVVEGSWKFTGLALDLNSSCSVRTIPIRFNDDFSEFSYIGLITYNDVSGVDIDTKTTFIFSKN